MTHQSQAYEEGMLYTERDGIDRINAEHKKYVDAQIAKVTEDSRLLVLAGVHPKHIAYVNRNRCSTYGGLFSNYDDFARSVSQIFNATKYPIGGYELESLAVDGDNLSAVDAALRETWEKEPDAWEEYVAERNRRVAKDADVDVATTGMKTVDLCDSRPV